jgi:hypothetical protein
MNEPRRWLEDPRTPDGLRDVLSAATEVPPMPAEAHSHVAAFTAGLVVQGLPAKAAAASLWVKSATSLLGVSSTGKAVLVVSLMGAVGTGSYLMAAKQSSSTPAPTHAIAKAAVESSPSRLVVESSRNAQVQAAPAADSAEAPPRRSPAGSAEKRALAGRDDDAPTVPRLQSPSPGPSSVAAFEELTIADEARLLEKARSALANNPAQALEVVAVHQRQYPAGQLSAERELIAVDALLRLGRRQEAEQRAAPRLRQNPDSLYARRLRQLLTPGAP